MSPAFHQSPVHESIDAVWLTLGVVWVAGAVTAKRTAHRESRASRWLHIGAMVVAFALLFSNRWQTGLLTWHFLPGSRAAGYVGLALTVIGAGIAIWARMMLGGNWSATVTIKEGHTLVRKGPYAVVRHPIYSGALLAMLGTAIAWNEIRGLLAVVVAFVAWRLKSRSEEAFMRRQFGAEYARYQREVKALIPFVL